MRRTAKFAFSVLVLIGLWMCPRAAHAQWEVFDPNTYLETTLNYEELVNANTQLYNSWQTAVSHYNAFMGQLQNLRNIPSKYAQTFTHWGTATRAADPYGQNAEYNNALNSGTVADVSNAVSKIMTDATIPSSALGDLTNQHDRDKIQQVASRSQRQKASTADAILAAAKARQTGLATDVGLDNLQADILSTDPQDNTDTALAQKQTIAEMIVAKALKDTNEMIAAQTELLATAVERQDEIDNNDLQESANSHQAIQDGQLLLFGSDPDESYKQMITPKQN